MRKTEDSSMVGIAGAAIVGKAVVEECLNIVGYAIRVLAQGSRKATRRAILIAATP